MHAKRHIAFPKLDRTVPRFRVGSRRVWQLLTSLPSVSASRSAGTRRTYASAWRRFAGLAAARARGKVGGRPRKMPDSRIRQARKMRENGMAQTEIAEILGVGRTTLYQYLGPQKKN